MSQTKGLVKLHLIIVKIMTILFLVLDILEKSSPQTTLMIHKTLQEALKFSRFFIKEVIAYLRLNLSLNLMMFLN